GGRERPARAAAVPLESALEGDGERDGPDRLEAVRRERREAHDREPGGKRGRDGEPDQSRGSRQGGGARDADADQRGGSDEEHGSGRALVGQLRREREERGEERRVVMPEDER